jgi:hypothetical protein
MRTAFIITENHFLKVDSFLGNVFFTQHPLGFYYYCAEVGNSFDDMILKQFRHNVAFLQNTWIKWSYTMA